MQIPHAAGENHFTCRFLFLVIYNSADYLEYFSIIACA